MIAAPAAHYPIRERYFAASIDQLLALVLAVTVGLQLNQFGEVVQGFAAIGSYLAYYFLSETWLAATPGKWLFGLKVARLDGRRSGWFRVLIRTLTRLLELNPAILGGAPAAVVILLSKRKQRIGDMLARTIVVRR